MTLDHYIRSVGDHILEALTVTTDECLNGARGELGAAYSEQHKQVVVREKGKPLS